MRASAQARNSHIFAKERHGHYVEPAWCSRRLFEVEDNFYESSRIYDPACGWGTILEQARLLGHNIRGSDIVDRKRHQLGTRFKKRDFLTWRGPIPSRAVVVCNPPFDHVQEFCEHALELGAAKVAMICLTRRLNAAHWLQELPLQRIWLLTPRPSMPPGSWIEAGNKPGGGTQDFCWLVFERGFRGEPTIGWLHRDGPTVGSDEMTRSNYARYGIRLRSRHTGDLITLGHVFDTQEQRQAFINKDVCLRCNSVDLITIEPGTMWKNKHVGFVARSSRRKAE